jgi:hypothetical protein
MPEALSSFLISVSIIIALALFVPCIESIAFLLRRKAPKQRMPETEIQPSKSLSGEAA